MTGTDIKAFEAAQAEVFETGSYEEHHALDFEASAFKNDVFGGVDSSFASQIVNNFSNYSEGMAAKKVEFESALTKASETGSPDDVYAATKAMGDYQLQVLLATKVASKSSNAIEKLTNLQ